MKLYVISVAAQQGNIFHHWALSGRAHNDNEMTGLALKTIRKICPSYDGWHSHDVTVAEISKDYIERTKSDKRKRWFDIFKK